MRREGVFGINERVPDVSHPNPFRTRRFLRGVRTTIRLELVLGLKSGLWSELESTKRLGAKGLGYGMSGSQIRECVGAEPTDVTRPYQCNRAGSLAGSGTNHGGLD